MEIKVKCPDCGKMLRVTVEAEEMPKVSLIKKQKSETTWEDIVANKDKLCIGDEVRCQLKNGKVVYAVVAAINPYGDNRVAFVFKDCIGEDQVMNDEATNKGGWRDCKMREYVNTEILALLPDDLKSVIRPRTIKQSVQGEDCESTDSLWLLSYTEVFGGDYRVDVGDVHFPLFDTEGSRVKMNEEGSTWCYWLRSANNTNYFRLVSSNGNSYNIFASLSGGVALGFLV